MADSTETPAPASALQSFHRVVFLVFLLAFGTVFMALHVFVSFMQAYIFTLLSMIYVSFATAHEH